MHQIHLKSFSLVFLFTFFIFFNFSHADSSQKQQNIAAKNKIIKSKAVGPNFYWHPNHAWQMDRFLRDQFPQYFLFRNNFTKKIIYVNYESPNPEELKKKCPLKQVVISLKNNEKLSFCFEDQHVNQSVYFIKKYDENLSWRYNFVSKDKLSISDWKSFFTNWTFEI